MIEFEHVCMAYRNGARALRDVNFTINDGEFVFITGSSGSGKTTIVRLLLREQTATEGRVVVNGTDLSRIRAKDIPFYRRRLGVVFQDFRLLKDSTIFENIAFARQIVGAPKSSITADVTRVLEQVGLAAKYRAYPSELSGGEQQRVAIARAMVNSPEVIIADEPTGNLDPANAWNIMQLLDEINRSGTTVIVVTHSKEILDGMNRRVIRVRRGTISYDGEWNSESASGLLKPRPFVLREEAAAAQELPEEDDEDEAEGGNAFASEGFTDPDDPELDDAELDDAELDDPELDDPEMDDPEMDPEATRPIDLSALPTEEVPEGAVFAGSDGSGTISRDEEEAKWNAAYIEDTEVREAEGEADTTALGDDWFTAFLPADEKRDAAVQEETAEA